jgi:hypothetical protein
MRQVVDLRLTWSLISRLVKLIKVRASWPDQVALRGSLTGQVLDLLQNDHEFEFP